MGYFYIFIFLVIVGESRVKWELIPVLFCALVVHLCY